MECPRCHNVTVYESYHEHRTVTIVAVGLKGFPVRGNDSEAYDEYIRGYHCGTCAKEWESWAELRAEWLGMEG